jgi:signal transduction histidine kinase
MDYAPYCQDDPGQPGSRQDAHLLSAGSPTHACPTTTLRFSEGIFWFFIATTIFLALLDAHVRWQAPMPLAAGWVGVFVLYYMLRSRLTLPVWHALAQLEPAGWLRGHCAVSLQLLLDLLVITGLLALSGGWASPLYMLYLGWASALLDDSSTVICLCFTGLACSAFVLGALLAVHRPFSALDITMLAEHVLLLLLVALSVNGVKAYIKHTKSAWEAERCRWDALRQTVFAHLSHELYTPLSAISASASLLAASRNEPATQQEQQLLRAIERNCLRMNVLIDDLLAMWKEHYRQFDYVPQRLCCLPLVAAVGEMLGPLLAGKQQRLVVVLDPEDVCVLADRRRLEQVLVNLLANAQKYAPVETKITLTVSGQGREVLFAVHDEGAGVPLEEQGHLFELFYRGANCPASSRGSGIGLALSKALVVLQGGHIWIESMPGGGSTFYFSLPAAGSG